MDPADITLSSAPIRDDGVKLSDRVAIEKVDYASDEINKLLTWPEDRLRHLQSDTKDKGPFARLRRA